MKMVILGGIALLAGCATGPQNQRASLIVSLNGLQEVPGPGDADGNGTAEINVTPGDGQICWNLYARQIDPATASHIHRGAEGIAGPPVLTLTTPDATGHSQGCATIDPALAREIAWQGYSFYLNVHTAAQPAGAIRGQLRGGPVSRDQPQAAPR